MYFLKREQKTSMKKEAIQKWRIFISILAAYAVAISVVFYIFSALTDKVNDIKEVTGQLQDKINLVDEIDQRFLNAAQEKGKYLFTNETEPLSKLVGIKQSIDAPLIQLKSTFADDREVSAHIQILEKLLISFFDSEVLIQLDSKSIKEKTNFLTQEQSTMDNEILRLRNKLVTSKRNETSVIYSTITDLKTTGYILIVLPFIFVIFIFRRIMKIFDELSNRSKQTHLLNEELQHVRVDMEDANWVLHESTILYEAVTGLVNKDEIARVSFETILKTLNFHAGTIYVLKMDTGEYTLRHHSGIDKGKDPLSAFVNGEGLLGLTTEHKEIKIISAEGERTLQSSTSLTTDTIKKIILVPLVYEDISLGLLEIGGEFDENTVLPRIVQYLQRVSRTIAMTIKFGQSRALVENLLEETQQQTEELEAQQEELRITNEELIYKTNLLEASEEELRVQQEELQQTNTELEEKAKQLELRNEDLNLAKVVVDEKIHEVELASRYKSEFMANMSHELRTPLNSILILAKLLQDNKTLNPEQVKYASVIHSAGSDLLELINQLLDLAKIESGKVDLHYETIRLVDFSDNVESLFAMNAQDKEINFSITVEENVPTEFVCDEYRLEQVLKNFLANAFKFTEKQGSIDLKISADEEHMRFTVRDNGKGISPEKQQLIFEAFRQEDGSTSRKYGGTGLGLSISKEIASLLGGRISLESALGEGSMFTLIIPLQLPLKNSSASTTSINRADELLVNPIKNLKLEDTTAVATKHTKQPVLPKNLLIIEDDNNFADILKSFAEDFGFTVMLAHDGAEGIEKAKQYKPHAVILDVMLPVSDGWEVLRTLKATPETKHIPIHMMSAASFNQRAFIESGAIGFLAKPITQESLKKAFENINLNIREGIKKVLLIEDQEFQSHIIKSEFAEKEINVIQAFSAQSAMLKLEEEDNIDCIILDIKLPDADGLHLLDKIKALPKYQETPIIINTAYDLSKEQIDHIRQHTQAMIIKSSKSNNRLIDEVNLFLNKISSEDYSPVKNLAKLESINKHKDSLSGKRVLVADDDMRNIFALSTVLQEYNMEVEIANNGLEAVDIVNNKPDGVDIVLMDIMMPEMDGYEAIAQIRANPAFSKLPIIAVTAKAMKGDREKSMQIGANDYISKPIDIDKLVSLMRVWLS